MTINTRSTLDKALKYIYEPGMNFALTTNTTALNAFSKRKFPGQGKAYVFATHLKRNQYVASRKHDGYYAPSGTETPENGSVTPTYTHIGFEITNDVVKAAKGDRAAFKDAMRMVMDTARDTIQTDLNRQFLGDGSGIIVAVDVDAGGAATETLTVKAGYSTKLLQQGMPLDFWNGNVRVNGGAGELPTDWMVVGSVIDDTQFTVTMFGGGNVPAIADGSYATRMGNCYAAAGPVRTSLEANGLRLFADDGTLDPTNGLHGISGTTYDAWSAIIKDAALADAGPGLASAVGILFKQASPFKFNQIWAHDNQGHGLIYGTDGSYKDKRFVNGSVTDVGDNTEAVVINVGGRKVRVNLDWFISETEMYFLDAAQIRYVELNGVELEEQADGQYLTPYRDSTGSKPAQVGYWMFRGNWATVARNAIARIYNLSKPASLPW
jgi:hypothetical protein